MGTGKNGAGGGKENSAIFVAKCCVLVWCKKNESHSVSVLDEKIAAVYFAVPFVLTTQTHT